MQFELLAIVAPFYELIILHYVYLFLIMSMFHVKQFEKKSHVKKVTGYYSTRLLAT